MTYISRSPSSIINQQNQTCFKIFKYSSQQSRSIDRWINGQTRRVTANQLNFSLSQASNTCSHCNFSLRSHQPKFKRKLIETSLTFNQFTEIIQLKLFLLLFSKQCILNNNTSKHEDGKITARSTTIRVAYSFIIPFFKKAKLLIGN